MRNVDDVARQRPGGPEWADKMEEDAAEAGAAAAAARADEDDVGRRRHARGAKATNQARGVFPGSTDSEAAPVSTGRGAGAGRVRSGGDEEMDDQDREDAIDDDSDGEGNIDDEGAVGGDAAAAASDGGGGGGTEKMVTIGLVGQPNVGKSTVLNSLMGRHVVQCSSTPGRTKHYQTHFMTPTLRLCDCPGLIFPAVVPRSLQVLAGLYPVNQLREPYSAIQFLAERVDLIKQLRIVYVECVHTYIHTCMDTMTTIECACSWGELVSLCECYLCAWYVTAFFICYFPSF